MPEIGQRKREVAYKLQIGEILRGNPIIEITSEETPEAKAKERFKFLELNNDKKRVVRVNIIANIIDKFLSEGEKKFATITLDDATGQIQAKVFGDDVKLFEDLNHGETILLIGVLRSFNKEVYLLPEIIKKTDPRYLLVRKLEIQHANPEKIEKTLEQKQQAATGRERIIFLIKQGEEQGGADIEQIILQLKEISPDIINLEIRKLLEDGIIYEPRPGKVRWLG